MSDEVRLPDPLAALGRLPRGAGLVLRHYRAQGREGLARELMAKAKPRGIAVLVAGDSRLAARVRAGGQHMPEALVGAPLALDRKILGKKPIVTMAAHSVRAVFRAARLGADAAILGPVFATASHPGRRPLGHLRLARICRQSPIPVYAVGGIGPGTARRLKGSGAAGIAGIGAVLPPGPPGAKAQIP
jgi:thiamine-phosphate pyrophosphorylase